MQTKPPVILARIGMRCIVGGLDNGDHYQGTICQMFDDTCVIRLDEPRDTSDGDAPNVGCIEWNEVHLLDVRPDPAQITSLDPIAAPADVAPDKCIVRPGMRVEIPIGDGNDDREGTVVAALPDCCVVKLDERSKSAGWFAAADWDLVTVRNLAPESEGGGANE